MNLSSMNPDVARKLLSVGELFRIQGPFFSYEEIKDQSPLSLSGGEKRRVAIAGVLATKPELLMRKSNPIWFSASTPMRSSTPSS